jgi:uncharacterized protein YchJ
VNVTEKLHEIVGSPLVRKQGTRRWTGQGRDVPRNSPCACGSGKKYKRCHGRLMGSNEQ